MRLQKQDESILLYAIGAFFVHLGVRFFDFGKQVIRLKLFSLHLLVKFPMLVFDLAAMVLFIVRENRLISAIEEYNLDPKGVADFSSVFETQRFFIDVVGIR